MTKALLISQELYMLQFKKHLNRRVYPSLTFNIKIDDSYAHITPIQVKTQTSRPSDLDMDYVHGHFILRLTAADILVNI